MKPEKASSGTLSAKGRGSMWIGWRGFYPGEAPAVSNSLGLGFFVCFFKVQQN